MSNRFLSTPALAALVLSGCTCGSSLAPVDPKSDGRPRVDCPLSPPTLAGLGGAEVEPVSLALDAFDRAYDQGRFDVALACAQEAARLDPEEPAAHHDRALAFEALDDRAAAAAAWQRTVALNPDDAESLLGASRFLLDDGSDDALETAVLWARRGREKAERASLGAELAGLEAAALNDLGRAADALVAAETALALDGTQVDALVERAVALFELLRFDEAGPALETARQRLPDNARVLWYLGLQRERAGQGGEAERLFGEAARLDPKAFPRPLHVGPEAFRALVDAEVARLPAGQRGLLGEVKLEVQEVPALDDLVAGDPVLSPTIVGLYRPDPAELAPPTIVLYRRNLLRIARDPTELSAEVRKTLLHELGHHGGEDDAALRDRGL